MSVAVGLVLICMECIEECIETTILTNHEGVVNWLLNKAASKINQGTTSAVGDAKKGSGKSGKVSAGEL